MRMSIGKYFLCVVGAFVCVAVPVLIPFGLAAVIAIIISKVGPKAKLRRERKRYALEQEQWRAYYGYR